MRSQRPGAAHALPPLLLLLLARAAASPPNETDIRRAMCKDICSWISGLDTFYENGCFCILGHEPTQAEAARVERAVERARTLGMDMTPTVVGYDRSQDREERCLLGLASALQSRSARGRAVVMKEPVVAEATAQPLGGSASAAFGSPGGNAGVVLDSIALDARDAGASASMASAASAAPPGTVPVKVLTVAGPLTELESSGKPNNLKSRLRDRFDARATAPPQAAGRVLMQAAASAPAPRYAFGEMLVAPVQTGATFLESPMAAYSSMAGDPPQLPMKVAVPVITDGPQGLQGIEGAPFSGVMSDGAYLMRSAGHRAAEGGRLAAHTALRQATDMASAVTGAGLGAARDAVSGGQWAADASLRTADEALSKAEAMANAALHAQMEAAGQTAQYLLPHGFDQRVRAGGAFQDSGLARPWPRDIPPPSPQRLFNIAVMNPGQLYPDLRAASVGASARSSSAVNSPDTMQTSASAPQTSYLTQRSTDQTEDKAASKSDKKALAVEAALRRDPTGRSSGSIGMDATHFIVDLPDSRAAVQGLDGVLSRAASGAHSTVRAAGIAAQDALASSSKAMKAVGSESARRLGEGMQAAASQAVEAVRVAEGAAAQGVEATQAAQQAAVQGVKQVSSAVQSQMRGVAGEVQGSINDAASKVRTQVQQVAGEGADAVRDAKETVKSALLNSAAHVQGQVQDMQQSISSSVQSAQAAARDSILAAASAGASSGQQMTQGAVDAAQAAVTTAIEKVRLAMKGVGSGLGSGLRQVSSYRSALPAFQNFEQGFRQGFQQDASMQQEPRSFQSNPPSYQQGLSSFPQSFQSPPWTRQALDGVGSDAASAGLGAARAAGLAVQAPLNLGLGAARDGLGMAKAAISSLPLGWAGRSATGLGLNLAASAVPARSGSASWTWSPSSPRHSLDSISPASLNINVKPDHLHTPVFAP